jgi:hypothetical protein
MPLDRALLNLGAYGIEDAAHVGANGTECRNHDKRDQHRDQAIFDQCDARFVDNKSLNGLIHDCPLNEMRRLPKPPTDDHDSYQKDLLTSKVPMILIECEFEIILPRELRRQLRAGGMR